MITMDYKDAGAYAMIFFMVAVIVILIPVFWVGDLAIALVDFLFSHPPKIVYITSWILASGGYYFYILERYVANVLLAEHERSFQIIVFYAQGLFFGYLVTLSGVGKWSAIPLKLLDATIGGVFRWLFS